MRDLLRRESCLRAAHALLNSMWSTWSARRIAMPHVPMPSVRAPLTACRSMPSAWAGGGDVVLHLTMSRQWPNLAG